MLNAITLKQQLLEGKQRLNLPSKHLYMSKVITLALGRYFETDETTKNQQMWEGIKEYLQHSMYQVSISPPPPNNITTPIFH